MHSRRGALRDRPLGESGGACSFCTYQHTHTHAHVYTHTRTRTPMQEAGLQASLDALRTLERVKLGEAAPPSSSEEAALCTEAELEAGIASTR